MASSRQPNFGRSYFKLLPSLRRVQSGVPKTAGGTVLTTASGEAALAIAVEEGPDLILMDIQLPDVSGIEATRRLKADARTQPIPIIAVTAFAMSGDRAII